MGLSQHLVKKHGVSVMEPENLIFTSFAEFSDWKDKMEEETLCYYSKHSGMSSNQCLVYYCQLDGSAQKTHRKTTEPARKTSRRNKKGRIKSNFTCTSLIRVQLLEDKSISVCYYPSHTHEICSGYLRHQPLSETTNHLINEKLACQVPPEVIVSLLEGDSYERQNRGRTHFRREHDIKLKTIQERKRRVLNAKRISNDDASSIFMKVETMQSNERECCPIILYKPYMEDLHTGPKTSKALLPKDVFMLGIQTVQQLERMKEGCKTILIMDETHGLNQYDFKLLNLLIKDHFNRGYPVGHLISSKSDEATLRHFFLAIKERCPDMEIKCCITDDDPALINALNSGFAREILHILCKWHTQRTFQKNLHRCVRDTDLETEMFQVLCLIIDASSVDELNLLVSAFIHYYENKAPMFMEYFRDTSLPKIKKWAMCYRKFPHGNVDETMFVEAFHNIIKTKYLKRKPLKRIDDLMDLLLLIEKDYFKRWFNDCHLRTARHEDEVAIEERHVRGMKINDNDVLAVSSGLWRVKSQTSETQDAYYDVHQCEQVCSADVCIFKCKSNACGNLCSHLFICTCDDIDPLCKHIHKLVSMEYRHSVNEPDNLCLVTESVESNAVHTVDRPGSENIVGDITESVESNAVSRAAFNSEKKVLKVKELLGGIEGQLSNETVQTFMLTKLTTILREAYLECTSLTKMHIPSQNVSPLAVTRKIAPSEKLATQLAPLKKKPKKKKRTVITPGFQERVELRNFFLSSGHDEDISVDDDLSHQSSPSTPAAAPSESCTSPSDVIVNEAPLSMEDIYAFFKVLEGNGSVLSFDFQAAKSILSNGQVLISNPDILVAKEQLLVPVQVADEYWVALVVLVSENLVLLYNPLSSPHLPVNASDRKLVEKMVVFLRSVFPHISRWNFKSHIDLVRDKADCGLHICWFGYQFSTSSELTPLMDTDTNSFREFIFTAISALNS